MSFLDSQIQISSMEESESAAEKHVVRTRQWWERVEHIIGSWSHTEVMHGVLRWNGGGGVRRNWIWDFNRWKVKSRNKRFYAFIAFPSFSLCSDEFSTLCGSQRPGFFIDIYTGLPVGELKLYPIIIIIINSIGYILWERGLFSFHEMPFPRKEWRLSNASGNATSTSCSFSWARLDAFPGPSRLVRQGKQCLGESLWEALLPLGLNVPWWGCRYWWVGSFLEELPARNGSEREQPGAFSSC